MSEAEPASIPLEERLIVALDVPTVDEARAVIARLGSAVRFHKIGMQLQFAGGLDLARELVGQGRKVFLDSKLLDIGQTVTSAVENIARMGVSFLTIHGTSQTIRAAVQGRGASGLKLLAVTVLTSMDAEDVAELGLSCPVEDLVLLRTRKALDAGCDGVIASGREAASIRKVAGDRLLLVVPGIRSAGIAQDDQKRATTPADAIQAGADYLVVGREILRADNPAAAAESVLRQIDEALQARRA
jgi:orotidine-5'-phosphate decarboxylase